MARDIESKAAFRGVGGCCFLMEEGRPGLVEAEGPEGEEDLTRTAGSGWTGLRNTSFMMAREDLGRR